MFAQIIVTKEAEWRRKRHVAEVRESFFPTFIVAGSHEEHVYDINQTISLFRDYPLCLLCPLP